ncbi:GTPase-activating protein gyp3 [Sphaceloma murrayae]|uniref:GTPase-activating protein gyp3 n=1 Tax=Sphaceloma murrayae TaxID=2082308 RepID=A0A2K1R2G8_9PEZI|nr:GTPase-activating protein gyp3 [Sphaceloma murrayae]
MYENVNNPQLRSLLIQLHHVHEWLDRLPYSIQLYIKASDIYSRLGYPDLAVGAAYKALLLVDAIEDDCDEFHREAIANARDSLVQLPAELMSTTPATNSETLKALPLEDPGAKDKCESHEPPTVASNIVEWVGEALKPFLHLVLAENLLHCGCYRSAFQQCQRGLQQSSSDKALLSAREAVFQAVRLHFERSGEARPEPLESDQDAWPDAGLVRRENYPWNDYHPDRFSQDSLDLLNQEMSRWAPKLEVKAVDLPALLVDSPETTSKQLGVFAREDLHPGDIILDEVSLLTANNRLLDPLCDACGVDIEAEAEKVDGGVTCDECYTVFCSEKCLEAANDTYHPAVCDRGIDAVARDVPPAQAADSLYLLLLVRSLAMATTQELHPLNLRETKFIWGDYHALDLPNYWQPATCTNPFSSLPRALPFNYSLSVLLPFDILTKMDINIFTSHRDYDVWIFNTLYAKFRGTASARFSKAAQAKGGLKLGRRMQGPEVSAVHPCWCLANHSCDPNVAWEWGGQVQFKVREERVKWDGHGRGETKAVASAGIRKGEEVLNHYCDVRLSVDERRGWAKGALGGNCRCDRCKWEAGEE